MARNTFNKIGDRISSAASGLWNDFPPGLLRPDVSSWCWDTNLRSYCSSAALSDFSVSLPHYMNTVYIYTYRCVCTLSIQRWPRTGQHSAPTYQQPITILQSADVQYWVTDLFLANITGKMACVHPSAMLIWHALVCSHRIWKQKQIFDDTD